MKQIVVIFLVGFLTFESLGQQSVDIGIFGGAGTYLGDMTKVGIQKSLNPAYGGFLRYNFNPRYAFRFNVLNGNIGAEGNFNAEPWAFKKNVLDLSLFFEFNYLKYIIGDKVTPWSSFIFFGVGMQMYNYQMDEAKLSPLVDPSYFLNADASGSVICPTIPFGLGIKYNLTKRIGVGLEASLHKSFSDKLDDLDDPLSYLNTTVEPAEIIKYTDTWHNNDWTTYIDVHLVYKLIYGSKQWS